MKNSNDTIGNRTRDLPTCSAVPQPTAPPSASGLHAKYLLLLSDFNGNSIFLTHFQKRKYPNTKFKENPLSRIRDFFFNADRHDEGNILISKFLRKALKSEFHFPLIWLRS